METVGKLRRAGLEEQMSAKYKAPPLVVSVTVLKRNGESLLVQSKGNGKACLLTIDMRATSVI